MEDSDFILEWRIENFSCWMDSAHGKSIICRQPSMVIEPGQIELTLHPKGRAGSSSNQMEITFVGPNILFREEGDLTILAPDGSILFTRRMNEGMKRDLHRVVGPNFQEVVTKIEQSEHLHGDNLTIQFKCRNPEGHCIQFRTTLDVVLDTSLKITQPSPSEHGKPVTIASFRYIDGRNIGEQRMLVVHHDRRICLKPIPAVGLTTSERPWVQYRLSVFDGDNVLVEHWKGESQFLGLLKPVLEGKVPPSESGGYCVLRLKIMNGIIQNDCRDFFPSTTPFKNAPERIQDVSKGSLPLSEDLRSLYRDKEFSDFLLKCGGVTFPVHRSILCARSPVFKTMFSSNMREAASSSVVIEDMDPVSLELFLVFLYTGSFEEVASDSALKLYYAADKYQVQSLVKECADRLCANVCISNVCDVLALGDRHRDERVTSAAQNFILKNFKEVTKSEEWRDYMNTNPQLLVKTVTHFAANGHVGYICS